MELDLDIVPDVTETEVYKAMDSTTLIILIVVLVLLFGGGGFWYRGRRGN